MTERKPVNKPRKARARPLGELIVPCVGEAFKRQGFASIELVTHWDDIAGADIAAHCEPVRLQWPRAKDPDDQEPATLVVRVDGPAAIEVQHMSGVLIERVNRFFGWQAVGRIALRQAPLTRRAKAKPPPPIDAAAARRIAEALPGIGDDDLRAALGRLGAAIKRT